MTLHLGDLVAFTFAGNHLQGIVYYKGKHAYSVMTSYGSRPIREDMPYTKILHRHKHPVLHSTEEVKNFYPEYFI